MRRPLLPLLHPDALWKGRGGLTRWLNQPHAAPADTAALTRSRAPLAPSHEQEVRLHRVESISDLHNGGERGAVPLVWVQGAGRNAGAPACPPDAPFALQVRCAPTWPRRGSRGVNCWASYRPHCAPRPAAARYTAAGPSCCCSRCWCSSAWHWPCWPST